jgi:hypothetical protein
MEFKSIMVIAGAATAIAAFEPTTLLVKVAYGLLGGAAGAIIADPLQTEINNLRNQIAALKTVVVEEAAARATQTREAPSS